jgi:sporulation protein YlmC with PRC-barrel domain
MITKDLIGKEVLAAEGAKIGKVKDIVIDKDSWTVTGLALDPESNIAKEFNLRRMWSKNDLTIPVANVQGVADRIILKISKLQLQETMKTSIPGTEKGP